MTGIIYLDVIRCVDCDLAVFDLRGVAVAPAVLLLLLLILLLTLSDCVVEERVKLVLRCCFFVTLKFMHRSMNGEHECVNVSVSATFLIGFTYIFSDLTERDKRSWREPTVIDDDFRVNEDDREGSFFCVGPLALNNKG